MKWLKKLLQGISKNDPVKHCKVYKAVGCVHVDGMLCDMRTCTIEVPATIHPRFIQIHEKED